MNTETTINNELYNWVSDYSDNENNNYDINLSETEREEIVIQRIILNIISMDIHKVKYLINKNNINVNNPFFDYVYNEDKGQVIYNRTLLVWCLLLYQDNISVYEFNHQKLYNFIYYLIKEKINFDDTNTQIQDSLELISNCMVDIEFYNQNYIPESKQNMMLEHLKKLDTKLTFLWAQMCTVNQRSTIYNYT